MSLIAAAIFNFAMVIFILWFFGRKGMSTFLVTRSETVGTAIQEAERESLDAGRLLAEWETNWKSCEAHAKRQFDEAQAALARFRDAALASAKTESERVKRDAVLAGKTETLKATESLQGELVDKSVGMARRYLEKSLTDKDRHALVAEYVEKVGEMARIDSVGARYAKAINDSLGKPDKVKVVLKELESFAHATKGHNELNRIFSSSIFPAEKRRDIVDDILKKIKVSADTRKIILVLAEMKRLGQLSAIVDRLHLLLLQAADIVPLKVEAATDLTADEKSQVEKRFSKILGKKVEAHYQVDPAVLAGLRVTASGRTFDGTISGWLSSFEERLAEGSK